MARNVAVQHLRGIAANMPALADGEFYFATDQFQLYVGLNGDALPVGGPMAIQVQGHANTNNYVEPASDGSLLVSLGGNTAAKSAVLKTNQLVTTAVTAGQVILTYTVTASKTLFLEYIDLQGGLTAISATASILGTVTISIGGVAVYTGRFVNPTTSDSGSQSIRFSIPEPIPLAAGTAISIAVTPAAATSMTWTANIGGYER